MNCCAYEEGEGMIQLGELVMEATELIFDVGVDASTSCELK